MEFSEFLSAEIYFELSDRWRVTVQITSRCVCDWENGNLLYSAPDILANVMFALCE